MKILELTNFSSGICGVWSRVKEEALRLSKEGHQVVVFTSNLTKGSKEIAASHDKINFILIKRFPAKKLGGESYLNWYSDTTENEIFKFKPDLIIAHSYRHSHTLRALKTAKKIGSKIFLVTHAPFVDKNTTRSLLAKWAVKYHDSAFGPSRKLNQFDKIIAITKWEFPYLRALGIKREKIAYMPNGIPEEFFSQKKLKETNKILFLGRVSPIKDLETLIKAIALISNKSIKLEILGPAEEQYIAKLKHLIKHLNLQPRILFSPPIFDIKKKISKIDSAKIFVLPSKREAMPQSLIEAMSREKIVIASKNPGSSDIITEGKNGYLFPVGDAKALAQRINLALSSPHSSMKKSASESVKQFSWDKIIQKLDKLILTAHN
ncbi:MAG: glycosyltransferase family 4 protein [Nanoarchaeota archaeon]|nr:glycosyltransferase family 4 protein [Nanoarchaeota archaeon]